MSDSDILNSIKDIMYNYVRQHYDKYRDKKKRNKLRDDEILKFTNKLYDKKKII